MNDRDFSQHSDYALAITRELMSQLHLSDLGVDEIGVYNTVLKILVSTPLADSEKESLARGDKP